MTLPIAQLRGLAHQFQAPMVNFVQQMVRIPSLPGQEADIAAVIKNEMNTLGYDQVWTDEVGNVVGKIAGGEGPAVMLNAHMDHVDPGPEEGWPYPPFSGQIVEGELWGRGSVDMKGPLACMVYAASLLKRLESGPPGDLFMTVPVMEEIGGLGTQHLVSYLTAQAAICGEPSHNVLRRGHRGRVVFQATFEGRSAHASAPRLGVNPHYAAAAFLSNLGSLELAHNQTLGASTVTPTLYRTDQTSSNVIPSRVELILDWRNVPDESPEQIRDQLQRLVDSCLAELDSGGRGTVSVVTSEYTTYTGVTQSLSAIYPSFLLVEEDRFVQAAHQALVEALERDDGVDIWYFATDGGHLMTADIPTIGFGPGDETLAHTNQERISLTEMEEALLAYAALSLALADAV